MYQKLSRNIASFLYWWSQILFCFQFRKKSRSVKRINLRVLSVVLMNVFSLDDENGFISEPHGSVTRGIRPTARHCASLRVIVRHYASLRVIVRQCASLRVIVRHYASLWVIARHCASLCVIVRLQPPRTELCLQVNATTSLWFVPKGWQLSPGSWHQTEGQSAHAMWHTARHSGVQL